MKSIYSMALMVACCVIMAGCNGAKKDEDKKDDKAADKGAKTTAVSMDHDLCAMCGHEKETENCCNDDCEKCDCGFHKGSPLCCVEGLQPTEGTYCKDCGHLKGEGDCCKDDCEACDCGFHKGAPLCCKLKDKDGDGHDHDGEDHDHDHDHEGDDHDHDKK